MSKLYIGNLSYDVDDNALHEAFSKYGQVTDHIVMKDRDTGRSRGYGFVTFEHEEEARKALDKMHNEELLGRRLRVNLANAKTGGGGSRGGYGEGSYGGGGGYGGGY
ncbi:hypothetical protein C8F01DRAFT_1151166 [Mycena amicta]|nr:hypothetical protein C8F01DRAFT_1151166 [Mycena amicta]